MKTFRTVILLFVMVCVFMGVNTVSVFADAPDQFPETETNYGKYSDDTYYSGFYGRLEIPAAGIDVALYCDMSQYVCDRADSACFFNMAPYSGMIIADHCNQEFEALTEVSGGMNAQIRCTDGSVIYLRCVDAFNGHNTGYELTDNDYNNVLGTSAYTMYTCIDGWRNVRICRWEAVEKEVIQREAIISAAESIELLFLGNS